MNIEKRIILDANILLRAVFGVRVLALLETYEGFVSVCTPDVCFTEAEIYVPAISQKCGMDLSRTAAVLKRLPDLVQIVDKSLYEQHEPSAKARIGHRDMKDWPIVATALLLECPIWTEDHDFFGTGIPTWTSQTIELYLRAN